MIGLEGKTNYWCRAAVAVGELEREMSGVLPPAGNFVVAAAVAAEARVLHP